MFSKVMTSFINTNFIIQFKTPTIYDEYFKKYYFDPKKNPNEPRLDFNTYLSYVYENIEIPEFILLENDDYVIQTSKLSSNEITISFFEQLTLPVFKVFEQVYQDIVQKKIRKQDYNIPEILLYIYKVVNSLKKRTNPREENKELLQFSPELVEIIRFKNCIPHTISFQSQFERTSPSYIVTTVVFKFEYFQIQHF